MTDLEKRIVELEQELAVKNEKLKSSWTRNLDYFNCAFARTLSKTLPDDVTSVRSKRLSIGDTSKHFDTFSIPTVRMRKFILSIDHFGNLTRIVQGSQLKTDGARLVGCINSTEDIITFLKTVSLIYSARKSQEDPCEESPLKLRDQLRHDRTFTFSEFFRFAQLLTPIGTKGSFLFSATPQGKETTFCLEGQILSGLK